VRDADGDSAEYVAEGAGAVDLVQGDGPDGARGAGDGLGPEPLDVGPAGDQRGVLRQQPGALGVERRQAGRVARIE